MQKRCRHLIALFLSFVVLAPAALAQKDKSKRPSPPANAACKFSDGKTITVDYSSPRMKGRKIFGELIPYGKVWRAGANEATTFVITGDVTVGGKRVPAGKREVADVDLKLDQCRVRSIHQNVVWNHAVNS